MNNKKLPLVLAALLLSLAAQGNQTETASDMFHRLYIGVEGGVSRATNADVKPDWVNRDTYYGSYTQIPVGSANDNINLGSAANAGIKIGYAINQLIKLDLAYNYRGNFSASNAYPPVPRYVATDTTTYGLPGAGSTVMIHGVHSQAGMLNVNLFPDFKLVSFKPFCFAGVGVARNKISSINGYDLILKSHPDYRDVVQYGNTKTSLTWQIGAGIDYVLTNNIDIGLAYRFVDMGNFTTSRNGSQQGINTTAQPYIIKNLGVNECYLRLSYNI